MKTLKCFDQNNPTDEERSLKVAGMTAYTEISVGSFTCRKLSAYHIVFILRFALRKFQLRNS